jgi:predicted GH43/DUF377 family glycosyl hydrolase
MSFQNWKKLGKVFGPEHELFEHELRKSHCAVPFVDYIEGDIFKVYFSSRDKQGRSHTWYLVLDINKPKNIIEVSRTPVLAPGNLGCFDDSGAMGSQILNLDGEKYLYYLGWNLGKTVPFRNSIGLAISSNGGENFTRFSEGPIIDRNYKEPHFCATPFVIREGNLFRIWYLSCVGWSIVDDKPRHHYHIKYAESSNGYDWVREGKVAIDFKDSSEYAISVPCVLKEDDKYKMWFSSRGDKYRIRYAESNDGINFVRKDELVGVDVSTEPFDWDSDMIEYPHVFNHKNNKFMLYNGINYGESGFGLAVLEK